MAQRIERFSTVAAAGSSPTFVPHSFLDGTVLAVTLYVPDGHAGLTSWSFWYSTAQLLPKTAGGVVVANDREFSWELEDAPTGNNYQSRVANSDVFPHSFHVEVWINEITGDADLADAGPIYLMPLVD